MDGVPVLCCRKAQSATEYLMTYSWAILAIGIVGGVLYITVFTNNDCLEPIANGFPVVNSLTPVDTQFQIYADGSGTIVVRNNLDSAVVLQGVSAGGTPVTGIVQSIDAGQEYIIPVSTLVAGTFTTGAQASCFNNERVAFTYDVDGGLTGMQSSGKLSGRYY